MIGVAGFLIRLCSRVKVDSLVVLYTINVFLTFSLTQASILRYLLRIDTREKHPDWRLHIGIHVVAGMMCVTILVITVFEKFREGGWLTVVATGSLVVLCFAIKHHYHGVVDVL